MKSCCFYFGYHFFNHSFVFYSYIELSKRQSIHTKSEFNLAFIPFINEIVSIMKITIISLFFFTFLDFHYFQTNKGNKNQTFLFK
jgi:hypothetical protein